jgi:hypothetical protein
MSSPGKMDLQGIDALNRGVGSVSIGFIVLVIAEIAKISETSFPRELIMIIAGKFMIRSLPMIACKYSGAIVAFNGVDDRGLADTKCAETSKDIGYIAGTSAHPESLSMLSDNIGGRGSLKGVAVGDTGNCASTATIYWQINGYISNYTTRTYTFRLNMPIIGVICGHVFGIAMTQNGYFGWGDNSFGQLGLGDLITERIPVYACVLGRVIAADCGGSHVMMILYENTHILSDRVATDAACRRHTGMSLYGWGSNAGFRLGLSGDADLGDTARVPRRVSIDNVSAVSCGGGYSLILAAGCVYLCKDDPRGPVKLKYDSVVEIFACCYRFVIYLQEPLTHRIIRVFDEIPALFKRSAGNDFGYEPCRYEMINRGGDHSRDHFRSQRIKCSLTDLLSGSDLSGVLISIASTHNWAIVSTSRGLYLIEAECKELEINH